MPDEARPATAAAKPQAGIKPPHAEQLEAANRAGNRLHGNDKPFAVGLILVLQTQLRTNLSGAEIQTELLGSGVDLFTSGSVLEAELSDAGDDQIQFNLLGGRRESGLAENVVGVVADAESVVLEELTEVVGGLETVRAEPDGLPSRPITVNGFDHQLARQETTNTVIATQFVKHRLNLSESPIIVLHDTLPFSSL